MSHHHRGRGRVQLPHGGPLSTEGVVGAARTAGDALDWDPYDFYLAGFRSAYLDAEVRLREMPSDRHRAAFTLGVNDGRAKTDAPRSRWHVLAVLHHLVS